MKTEKNIIKAYIIIVILSLLIILPPVFRAFFPKQKTVIGEDQGNITTINCTKDYHTEKISETVEVRYIDSKIKYTKITYKPSTNTNQTAEEEDLTPSKELAYFKTLKDIDIKENEGTTTVTITNKTIKGNKEEKDLQKNYFNEQKIEQKLYFANRNFNCTETTTS